MAIKADNFIGRQLVTLLLLSIAYYLLIDLQSAYDQSDITTLGVSLLYIADVMVAWVFVNVLHYLFGLIFNRRGDVSYIVIAVTCCFYVFLDRIAMTTFDQHINLALWEAAYFAVVFNELHLSYKTFVFFIGGFLLLFVLAWLFYQFIKRLVGETRMLPVRFSIFVFVQLNIAFWMVNIAVYTVKDPERTRYLLPFADFFNVASWMSGQTINYPDFKTDHDKRKKQMSCLHSELEKTNNVGFEKPKNILIVTAESLRSTVFDAQRMPYLFSMKDRSDVLNLPHHYSTANATSTGIFGLVSGLDGLYYMDAKKEPLQMPPLKLLEKAGFDFNLYASRDIHYADVYDFMFSYLDHSLHTEYDKKIPEADARLVEAFKKSLGNEQDNPRIDFLFLYSTHYSYFYPLQHRLFTPDTNKGLANTEVPNIFSGKETWFVLYNRYQNAAHYIDSLMRNIINAIEQHSNPEDWIIVFTGDHGEELGEYGQLGHSFGFRKEQIQVPALIITPGRDIPDTSYTTTSHADILPTLLSYMGVNVDMEKYSTGKNLFEFNADKNFSASIANMMSFDTRYTQVIMNDSLKLRINDREYPKVQKVLTLHDQLIEEPDESAVGELIEKYYKATHALPDDC